MEPIFRPVFEDVFTSELRHTSFLAAGLNQSFSAELLANPDFSAWSGDNLSSWSTAGETGAATEVTQRSALQLHADSPAGTGAANFNSNTNNQPRISQTILTSGDLYEIVLTLTARASGNMAFGGFVGLGVNNFTTVSKIRLIGRANATTFTIQAGTQPTDITVVPASVKKITPNTIIQGPADFTATVLFDVPTDVGGSEEIALQYGMSGANQEYVAGYSFYARRRSGLTNSDLRLDRLAASLRTNLYNLSNVGASTDGLRIIKRGSVHTLDVHDAVTGAWTTKTTVTDATYDANRYINFVYPSDVTPRLFVVSE